MILLPFDPWLIYSCDYLIIFLSAILSSPFNLDAIARWDVLQSDCRWALNIFAPKNRIFMDYFFVAPCNVEWIPLALVVIVWARAPRVDVTEIPMPLICDWRCRSIRWCQCFVNRLTFYWVLHLLEEEASLQRLHMCFTDMRTLRFAQNCVSLPPFWSVFCAVVCGGRDMHTCTVAHAVPHSFTPFQSSAVFIWSKYRCCCRCLMAVMKRDRDRFV